MLIHLLILKVALRQKHRLFTWLIHLLILKIVIGKSLVLSHADSCINSGNSHWQIPRIVTWLIHLLILKIVIGKSLVLSHADSCINSESGSSAKTSSFHMVDSFINSGNSHWQIPRIVTWL